MKKLAAVGSLLIAAVLLLFPRAVSQGISLGLENAAVLLIPSLFPFMVLSSFMIRSGACEPVGKMLSPVTKFLFGLPAAAASAILMSLVGGFPVGAKCIRLLYENGRITHAQAKRMSDFCVCSGPAFLITAVGTLLLHNAAVGIILYLSQVLSAILLGMLSRLFAKDTQQPAVPSAAVPTDLMQSFILSCTDGASAIIELTAMVAVFSGIMALLPQAAVLLEVTAACKNLTDRPLWCIAFASGYGGLCVHFQIFSLLKDLHISKLRFELFRLANAALSAGITYGICTLFRPAVTTFAIAGNAAAELTSTSIVGAVSLLVMSGIFLLSQQGDVKIGNIVLSGR